ncbi:hypothetical protein GCM10007103_12970 [Salinimicrobium marinum]|uniref:Endonuclease/Exonuclease/phosphatase family protein n=1 Tax=Salinimicrobium marinum TaxID=680283 RepID=A0A918VVD3_9FLAO|nr:endonuclease/exonuclease/phosphatase family protein [Salinimicrobium marinum]GHA32927.1 hypothetical protein GCM10007103_12970 [Salinimicrobium marinum]
MKIATFNMENIFHRDRSLVKKSVSQSLTAWIEEFDDLMKRDSRVDNEFVRMRELSFLLGFHKSSLEPYVVMRRKAGQLYLRKRNACLDYKASHLTHWNGWIKLYTTPIDEIAVQNKAKLITEVNPDILLLQEVEDRQSLMEFNENFLSEDVRFDEVMVVPGNDPNGLDLGIMTKNGYGIGSIKSHSNACVNGQIIFEKDFQRYEIFTPGGTSIWILSAHLKETGADIELAFNKRRFQTKYISEVYELLTTAGHKEIVIAGTFNSPSYCASLSPLLRETSLKEVQKHPTFNVDYDEGKDASYHSLGAYRMGVNLKQKDYMLLSPELFKKVRKTGMNRRGIWPEKRGQYRIYESVQSETQQASSHPIIWTKLST